LDEEVQMQTPPFFSSKHPGVYHICSKCTEGRKIERLYKNPGTGGGTLCQKCLALRMRGDC